MDRMMFEQACYDAGDLEVRDNYSGRAMYGKTCIGVVGSLRNAFKLIAFLAIEDGNLAVDLADAVCTDSMGRSEIIYFPGFTFDEDEE
jgi:hypothetical protein